MHMCETSMADEAVLPHSCATDCPSSGETCRVSAYRKQSRKNTLEEKLLASILREACKGICTLIGTNS